MVAAPLTVETQEHALQDAELTCTACGNYPLEWTGESETSVELGLTQHQLVLQRHVRKRYRCSCGAPEVSARGPVRLPNAGPYALEFAIAVALEKYGLHVPLERQARTLAQGQANPTRRGGTRIEAHGRIIDIDAPALWTQLDKLASALQPTYAALLAHVTASEVVRAEESSWRVLSKLSKGGKSWWAWRLASHDAVYYRVSATRTQHAIAELLASFQGVLQVDDEASYATLAACLPGKTCVRSFAGLQRSLRSALTAHPEARRGVELIDELFEVERDLPDWQASRDPKLRDQGLAYIRDIRSERCKPLCTALLEWAAEQQTRSPGSGPLHQALESLRSGWPALTQFLDDPRVPCAPKADGSSEAAAHSASKSQRGTEVSALFYSLIESARLAGVPPAKYLRAAATAALTGQAVLLPHQLRNQR